MRFFNSCLQVRLSRPVGMFVGLKLSQAERKKKLVVIVPDPNFTVSVLGREEGYTVEGEARGNS